MVVFSGPKTLSHDHPTVMKGQQLGALGWSGERGKGRAPLVPPAALGGVLGASEEMPSHSTILENKTRYVFSLGIFDKLTR